jgi:hypothetical protein
MENDDYIDSRLAKRVILILTVLVVGLALISGYFWTVEENHQRQQVLLEQR